MYTVRVKYAGEMPRVVKETEFASVALDAWYRLAKDAVRANVLQLEQVARVELLKDGEDISFTQLSLAMLGVV